jgi:hypothetical protein
MAAASGALTTLPSRGGRRSWGVRAKSRRDKSRRSYPRATERAAATWLRQRPLRRSAILLQFGTERARTDVLSQLYFADLRLLGVILNDMPTIVALWRVAPSVRLRDFAIFESGSLRAMLFRRRRSSFDHGRRTGAFLLRIATLATIAPLHISTTAMALCMICATLQVLRRPRATVINFLDRLGRDAQDRVGLRTHRSLALRLKSLHRNGLGSGRVGDIAFHGKTILLEVNFSAVTMISTSALVGFCADDLTISASGPLAIKQE